MRINEATVTSVHHGFAMCQNFIVEEHRRILVFQHSNTKNLERWVTLLMIVRVAVESSPEPVPSDVNKHNLE